MIDSPRYRPAGIALLLAAVVAPQVVAMPNLHLIERDHVLLTVRPMNARPTPGSGEAIQQIELDDRGVELRYELEWPEPGHVVGVLLRASPLPPRPGVQHVVLLESEVTLPDRGPTRAKRELTFDESYTSLFDVHREDGRSLILAIEAELYRETALVVRREVGEPIQFQLEIQRLEDESSVSLETNRLNTFVGDPVTYSFRLGPTGGGESLSVTLTPRKLYGELARISVEVSGMLSDGEKISMISRQEDWLTTRGSTSTLAVAAGDPPAGFRFLVTPWF